MAVTYNSYSKLTKTLKYFENNQQTSFFSEYLSTLSDASEAQFSHLNLTERIQNLLPFIICFQKINMAYDFWKQ